MFLSKRIALKPLAELCRRLAVATDAGLDDRKTWRREAERAPVSLRRPLSEISDGIEAGDSLTDSISRTGLYFPSMFREMVEVGENTGSLPAVFRQLAEHYEHRLKLNRLFLTAIAWPMVQLGAAVVIIGVLILVMGSLGNDMLGFGLTGISGLIVYLMIVGGVAAGVAAVIVSARRGALWTRPLQIGLLRIPGIGRCFQTIALAQMSWVLHLTMNVAIDVRRALTLALRSTGNDYYRQHIAQVVTDVSGGGEIHRALKQTGAFPDDFIAAVEVGEQSGRLTESMGRLSHQYEEQARLALGTLSVIAGFAVYGMVAALIIFLIFRLAGFYVGTIYEALEY